MGVFRDAMDEAMALRGLAPRGQAHVQDSVRDGVRAPLPDPRRPEALRTREALRCPRQRPQERSAGEGARPPRLASASRTGRQEPARVLAADLLAHRRHRSAPLSRVRCWSAARRRGDPTLGSARQDHARFEITVTATSASSLGHLARRLTPLVRPVRAPSTAQANSKPFASAPMGGRSLSHDNFLHRRLPNWLTSPYPRITPVVQSP